MATVTAIITAIIMASTTATNTIQKLSQLAVNIYIQVSASEQL